MRELTAKQRTVLEFIAMHIVERQRPPTRKGMAQHFGWASANASEDFLKALEHKGYVALDCDEGSEGKPSRYVRVLRWPNNVLPVIRLAA
jgi:SOS-response transcriptional repressor LexA